ncbi:MAG: hypothetical protein IKP88_14335 [Lachnospiraceae bacterium]|nr:hypothetical protein [Lachnospiraceae bacterium]
MEEGKKLTPVKEILFTLLTYAVLYIISFLLLILLIRLPLFSGIKVLMYRGLIMIVLAGIVSVGLMIAFKKLRKISWLSAKDAVLVFILCCSINTVFFTLIPVTVERSVSVFMLSYMDTYNDRTYTEEEISRIFIDKYVYEYEAFGKRFEEQLATGSIEKNPDGSYSITSKGSFIVNLFKTISDIYDTDKRLVHPEGIGE